jgi:hypothetical protein
MEDILDWCLMALLVFYMLLTNFVLRTNTSLLSKYKDAVDKWGETLKFTRALKEENDRLREYRERLIDIMGHDPLKR